MPRFATALIESGCRAKQLAWRSSALWRILCDKMRKGLALAVALLIGLPLVAPLLAFNSSAAVPACCRRSGQHHCMGGMMGMPSSNQGAAIIGPRCPFCPIASAIPQMPVFVAGDTTDTGVALFVRPAALPQTEARFRSAFARGPQKRGPPAISS